jgi:Ubiquitin carboxyl-terminal hydrolase
MLLADGATYELKCILHHIGEANTQGHFTAHAIRSQSDGTEAWVYFDDSKAIVTDLTSVLSPEGKSSTACLLLYELKECEVEVGASVSTSEAGQKPRASPAPPSPSKASPNLVSAASRDSLSPGRPQRAVATIPSAEPATTPELLWFDTRKATSECFDYARKASDALDEISYAEDFDVLHRRHYIIWQKLTESMRFLEAQHLSDAVEAMRQCCILAIEGDQYFLEVSAWNSHDDWQALFTSTDRACRMLRRYQVATEADNVRERAISTRFG